ncbi:integral membrane protein, putative [Oceaniovalibus guishaninsula JLT2003]|uniref:Integral membrane protein, putative n=1 Tax=Oceaniovalibus guishaninsula JLT2003 TaxID=1231392 RepID=K2H6P3_9RHOB|nr:DMT family transporter [Oceaniovalibus guishaninsula]EKE43333.1 integral membrane protein, putative [Oceaniovalibus guishaninsula JLT2003]
MSPFTSLPKGPAYALGAFAVLATHDAIIKILGAVYAPFQIIFFSVVFGFPLATLMLMRDPTSGHLRPIHPWWVALRTAAGVMTGAAAFYAFSTIPLAQAYALLFAAPLLVTVLSIPILGESVGRHRWAAVVIGAAGVLIVLRPFGGTHLETGHAAALLAAFGGAVGSVIVRKIGKEERGVVLMLYPMVANFAVMACILPFVYVPMPLTDLALVGVIAVLAFVGGLMIIAAYRSGDATVVAPMQYSQIIWAAIFGTLFFNEIPDALTWIGAAVIILSGLYVVVRESRLGVSRTTPVLATRTVSETGTMPRISAILRERATRVPPGYEALAKQPRKQ